MSRATAADFMDISDDEGDGSVAKKLTLTQKTNPKPVSIKIRKEEEVWSGKVHKMSKHGQIKNTFNNITFFQKNSALAGADVRNFDLPNSLLMKGRCEMREVYSQIKKYAKKSISVIYAKTLSNETRMGLKNELTFQKPAAYISVNGNQFFIVLVELLKGVKLDIKGLDDRNHELVGIFLASQRVRRSNSRSNSRMDSEERHSRSASRSQPKTTAQTKSSQNHVKDNSTSQNLTNPEFLANAIMQAQQNAQVSQQHNTHNNWHIRSGNNINNVYRNLPRPRHVVVRHPQQFQRNWPARPINAHNP